MMKTSVICTGFIFAFGLILCFIFPGAGRAQTPYNTQPVVPKIWNLPVEQPENIPEAPQTETPSETPSGKSSKTPSEIPENLEIEVVPENSASQTASPTNSPTNSQTDSPTDSEASSEASSSIFSFSSWFGPEGISRSVLMAVILSAVSLAPAFVMMTTSFVRIFVVLGILRHGFGTQGIPGTQILAALALFITLFIMFPTWERMYTEALVPYQAGTLSAEDAWEKGWKPLRKFMGGQLEHTGNTDEILLFWRYSPNPPTEAQLASCTMEDVPTHVLLPAFMLSELKTAFLIGVQLLLPMLVIDLLVSAVLVSMGMYMLPPTLVSLPFKLLLFVLVDGWRLVVEMLLASFVGK